jgi:hypothetical protein
VAVTGKNGESGKNGERAVDAGVDRQLITICGMIHAVAAVGAIFWFGLNGLLWYAKPAELYWLAGSAVLGVIFFAGFFAYLQATDRGRT